MKTLYIERSTGDCRNGDWVNGLDLSERPDCIVVGTGPGSFAGVRSAIAFAQGYALGSGCAVKGLPSACSLADGGKVAVVGDARRGLAWVALFDGMTMVGDVFQVRQEELGAAVPEGFAVKTPDAARIGEMLRELFGTRFAGGELPTAEGLRRFAEANPSVLADEPLPLYLNPAVREI